MTKMDMVWVAVASLLHPRTGAGVFVRKARIDARVLELFGESVPPVLITHHLVNSVDRQADQVQPSRGGSRNRYLFRDESGGYRLYKNVDGNSDAWEKNGPTHPDANNVDAEYADLLTWYENDYATS